MPWHDNAKRVAVLWREHLAVHLVGKDHVTIHRQRLLDGDAGLHVVNALEDDMLHPVPIGAGRCHQASVRQHIAEQRALERCSAHGATAPRDAARLLQLVELTPAIASALDRGCDLVRDEAVFQVVEVEAHGLQAEALHLQHVLLAVDMAHRVVLPNEEERVWCDPVVQDQIRRQLCVAGLVAVENEGRMAIARILAVGIVKISRLGLHYVLWIQGADLQPVEDLDGIAATDVHLVEAPERIDGLSSREHDPVTSRMVHDEVGDVIDTVLVCHPRILLRVVLGHLS
mmetsp:Transcript_1194/g.2976  ORF Transcript_1194/g.2976 Transcript_1194/m.2976 type:complete len:286 (-) Transcript_1194:439-1296(-)